MIANGSHKISLSPDINNSIVGIESANDIKYKSGAFDIFLLIVLIASFSKDSRPLIKFVVLQQQEQQEY